MEKIHLESQRVGRKVETEMRRGKSFFEALAIVVIEAHDRQERQKKVITDAEGVRVLGVVGQQEP